jgi:hypothetical protein
MKRLCGGAPVRDDGSVPIAKFRDYISRKGPLKEGATHGKDAVFRVLGYGAEYSQDLVRIYEEQGQAKFARGEYTLGKRDEYGQRIDIEIELPGVGAAEGKTSYIKSGWMIRPEGGVRLNTPFTDGQARKPRSFSPWRNCLPVATSGISRNVVSDRLAVSAAMPFSATFRP